VVRDHRSARPGGADDGQLALERAREATRDPAGGCPVAGVEGRLAAADLAARELDLESSLSEQ
jgi:hypothetical protein